ncbi:MAG: hypothetical protein KJ629_09440 [Candidatus Omnitrophica bacterium]|nr:hypothetical protein [Candidatus Omnitrophota bacterium]
MLKKRFFYLSLGFFVIFFCFNLTWAKDNQGRRQQLKEQFMPQSQSIRQLQNINDNYQSTIQTSGQVTRRSQVQRQDEAQRRDEGLCIGEYAIYQSQYEVEIEEDIAKVCAKVNFEVFKKRGWLKIPLASSSVGLKEVTLNRKPSFVVREGNRYVLLVTKPGIYNLDLQFFIKVKREREQGPGSLSFQLLPSPISILDVEMQEPETEIFVDPSIKIETEKLAKKTLITAVLPFTENVTVRWSKSLPKEIIPKVVLEPKIYADATTLVSIGDGVAKYYTDINYSILQSEVSNLKISLPEDVGILNVEGRELRDWKAETKDGRQILDIYLNYGVKGRYSLNLTYEKNIGSGSVTAGLSEINILGAEREKGFVGVEALTNIELAFNKLTGASIIDVKELPQNIWVRARNPVLLAFKYLKSPYGAIIDVTKHSEMPVLVAAIDSSNYVTLFTEEGKALVKATYEVRNNVKQFLRLTLPKDASLWSCFVSAKPVKPAKDKQGRILIPLEKSQISGQALTQFPVEVVYLTKNSRPRLFGKLKMELPKLDIPQSELLWSVYFPEKFNYYKFDGDVELVQPPQVSFTARPQEDRKNLDHRRREVWSKKAKQSFGLAPQMLVGKESSDKAGADFGRQHSYSQVEKEGKVFEGIQRTATVSGVLPIKINVPQKGKVYRFTKLLVTDESPWMSAFYLRVPKYLKPLAMMIFFIILVVVVILLVKKIKLRIKKTNLS